MLWLHQFSQNNKLLLFFYTIGEAQIFKYTVSNMHFSGSGGYGEYCGIFDPKFGLQYVVLPALNKGDT
jgi:hypothetical protein